MAESASACSSHPIEDAVPQQEIEGQSNKNSSPADSIKRAPPRVQTDQVISDLQQNFRHRMNLPKGQRASALQQYYRRMNMDIVSYTIGKCGPRLQDGICVSADTRKQKFCASIGVKFNPEGFFVLDVKLKERTDGTRSANLGVFTVNGEEFYNVHVREQIEYRQMKVFSRRLVRGERKKVVLEITPCGTKARGLDFRCTSAESALGDIDPMATWPAKRQSDGKIVGYKLSTKFDKKKKGANYIWETGGGPVLLKLIDFDKSKHKKVAPLWAAGKDFKIVLHLLITRF